MEKNNIVRISNVLNLTRQEFSVIEKHIFHLLLKKIKSDQKTLYEKIDDEIPLTIKIDASEIRKRSNNTEKIKEAIKKLTSRNIHFDNTTNDKEYFGSLTPIYYARYEAINRVSSNLILKIAPECKPLFLDLAKGYTNLNLEAILNLKSEYAIRMYELTGMYTKQNNWSVTITELRSLLNLGDIKYNNFYDFEKYILKYSQKELMEHCNIYFTWEIAAKKGKKVTALTFNIQKIEQNQKIELSEEIKQTIDFVAKLSPIEIAHTYNLIVTKYNLAQKQADYIFTDKNRLNEFIRVDLIIEDMITKGKPPKDRTKYLAKSLGLDKIKF